MIGNNSCGATAQAYGKTVDNVRRLEVLTYDGLRMWVGPTTDEEYADIVAGGGRRAEIYRALRRAARRPPGADPHPLPRHPAPGVRLQPRLAAARERVRPGPGPGRLRGHAGHRPARRAGPGRRCPTAKAMVVLGYPDIAAAGDAVPQHPPAPTRGSWRAWTRCSSSSRSRPTWPATRCAELPAGGGWLMVQFAGDDQDEADAKAQALLDDLEGTRARAARDSSSTTRPRRRSWSRSARPASAPPPTPAAKHETWEGWEDAAVPPDRLGDYLRDFRALLDEFGYDKDETSLYGHFGQGCVHTRIPFELRTADGIAALPRLRRARRRPRRLLRRVAVRRARRRPVPRRAAAARCSAPRSSALFGQVKAVFDPDNRMNPGKVVDPNPLDAHLRLGTGLRATPSRRPYFAYPRRRRPVLHARPCAASASARCRHAAATSQVMCPSYMVTREEEHSTRGRARLLFEMVRGDGRSPTAGAPPRSATPSTCAWPARAASPTARSASTWPPTRPSSSPTTTGAGCVRRAHYSMGWLPLLGAARRPHARGLVNAVSHVPRLAPAAQAARRHRARARPAARSPPQPFTRLVARARPRSAAAAGAARAGAAVARHLHQRLPPRRRAGRGRACWRTPASRCGCPTQPVCCGLTWISTGQLDIARRGPAPHVAGAARRHPRRHPGRRAGAVLHRGLPLGRAGAARRRRGHAPAVASRPAPWPSCSPNGARLAAAAARRRRASCRPTATSTPSSAATPTTP